MEISTATGAPGMVKQRCSLLHSTIGSIGSRLALAGRQTDAASGQHDPQAGEQVEEFLELAPRGVFYCNPSERLLVFGDLSYCSKALPLVPICFKIVGCLQERWPELTVCW